MKINILARIYLLLYITVSLMACGVETDKPVEKTTADKLDALFNAPGGVNTPNGKLIVLTTRAFMGSVEKTVKPGLPLRFIVNYDKSKPDEISFIIDKFTFGKMPLKVDFKADAKLRYEAAAPKNRKDWLHFYSNKCFCGAWVIDPSASKFEDETVGNAVIDGYIQPDTGEIEILIVYQMMGVKTVSSQQKIDVNRIHRYEVELEEYIKLHQGIK